MADDEPLILWHPLIPVVPACPVAHLRPYGLTWNTFHALRRGLSAGATVDILLERYWAGSLDGIKGIGPVRAIDITLALIAAGLT